MILMLLVDLDVLMLKIVADFEAQWWVDDIIYDCEDDEWLTMMTFAILVFQLCVWDIWSANVS